ncbi:response regulator [Xylanimonas allomyrinae]|uniref:Response regulator n=1 Tax=Xylanimonas allomyrinae TaxID=2509459 RepID=A0A4V0YEA1_9MICO|nr:cellulose synthase operon protein YhjQ/BcsQ [Xylanimonas allomyrinae]QAY63491.1 response regulator [Xylanimonas allomyrinae]
MAGSIVIGCVDQTLAYELRAQLAELADVEIVGIAESTSELAELVVALEPNVVLVHDQLGPARAHQVVRDLGLRRPGTVAVVVSGDPDAEALAAAMDAGARGVLTYPLSFEAVQQRVTNALEWSRQIQGMLTAAGDGEVSARGRATVLGVTGSKGGVGTSSIVTHLAWDLRRRTPDLKIVVVDADLEKGDVTSYLAASARTSLADLAKVADDLSPRTVEDAVYEHESGLHLLLPPDDVRDVEWITPQAVRQVLFLLRQLYDVVIVDAGAHVTPVQAAVVEVADEVVQVVTPDLVSLRALRRNLGWWESLGVRKTESVHVLVNRRTTSDEVQLEAITQLAPAAVMTTSVPHVGRRLETATNSRAPHLADSDEWWNALRAVGDELHLLRAVAAPAATGSGRRWARSDESAPTTSAGAAAPRRSRKALRESETGAVSLELLGVLPVLVVLLLLLAQVAATSLTYVWAGHGAAAAAHAAAVDHLNTAEVTAQARDAVPAGLRDDVDVTVGAYDAAAGAVEVTVTAPVPLFVPGAAGTPWDVTVRRQVVTEP